MFTTDRHIAASVYSPLFVVQFNLIGFVRLTIVQRRCLFTDRSAFDALVVAYDNLEGQCMVRFTDQQ